MSDFNLKKRSHLDAALARIVQHRYQANFVVDREIQGDERKLLAERGIGDKVAKKAFEISKPLVKHTHYEFTNPAYELSQGGIVIMPYEALKEIVESLADSVGMDAVDALIRSSNQ